MAFPAKGLKHVRVLEDLVVPRLPMAFPAKGLKRQFQFGIRLLWAYQWPSLLRD